MADIAIIDPKVAAAPEDYTLPGAQEILLRAVGCTVNGANAGAAFLPALQMLDPSGNVMWTAVNTSQPLAVGGSALVSWFPGGGVSEASASSSSGTPASGITRLSSTGGTITVGTPTGPTANVDLPLTGATAGTYGDATHVGTFTVDAEGRLTTASSVAISGSGGAGGLIALYDSGYLGADSASIDTGAGGIASGHFGLLIMGYLRTDNAVAGDNVICRVNNDAGANYDVQRQQAANGSTDFSAFAALTFALCGTVPGNNDTANNYGALWGFVPAYDGTSNHKSGRFQTDAADNTALNSILVNCSWHWRSTSAISRMTFLSQTGGVKIKAGSRIVIYGVQ